MWTQYQNVQPTHFSRPWSRGKMKRHPFMLNQQKGGVMCKYSGISHFNFLLNLFVLMVKVGKIYIRNYNIKIFPHYVQIFKLNTIFNKKWTNYNTLPPVNVWQIQIEDDDEGMEIEHITIRLGWLQTASEVDTLRAGHKTSCAQNTNVPFACDKLIPVRLNQDCRNIKIIIINNVYYPMLQISCSKRSL